MIDKIKKVIEIKINPLLKSHNGAVEFVEIIDNIVYVRMLGACSACLSSGDTFNNIIRSTLKNEIPEIKEVAMKNGVSDELIEIALKIINKNKH